VSALRKAQYELQDARRQLARLDNAYLIDRSKALTRLEQAVFRRNRLNDEENHHHEDHQLPGV